MDNATLTFTASGVQYSNPALARERQDTRTIPGTKRPSSGLFSPRQGAKLRKELEAMVWPAYVMPRHKAAQAIHARGIAITVHDHVSTYFRQFAAEFIDHTKERQLIYRCLLDNGIQSAVLKSESSHGLVHLHGIALADTPVDLQALNDALHAHVVKRLNLAVQRLSRAKSKTDNRRTIGKINLHIQQLQSLANNVESLQSLVDVQALYYDGDILAPLGWICYLCKPTDYIPGLKSYTLIPNTYSRRANAEGGDPARTRSAHALPQHSNQINLSQGEIEPFFQHLKNHQNPAISNFAQRFDADQATGFSIYASPQEIQELIALLIQWRSSAQNPAQNQHQCPTATMATPAVHPAGGGEHSADTAIIEAHNPHSSNTRARAGPDPAPG